MSKDALSPPDQFKGDWITPDHHDYTQSIARWAANAIRRASAVAFVKDAEDVAIVIAYARANGLSLAIRGGGHNVAGASSVKDGVVIDLSRHISGVRVDPDKRLAYVGGGAVWETVDKAGMKYGLATPGGTINHVGISFLSYSLLLLT